MLLYQTEVHDISLSEMTIEHYHLGLETGQISTYTLVNYYLNRIKTYDPLLKSIITVNPLASEEAIACDEAYKKTGLLGPLHGVPVIIKDNIETKGLLTTGGSLTLKDYVPSEDAYIVKKLKEAGAIIIAKANLHEFAIWGETISSVLGQTYNPYDLTRTPGGSSGGTGASIAADFALVGIGTDTVNSVRSPASATNLVGFKPTLGLISRQGIIPYSYTQDTAGPMTRSVMDTIIVTNVIKGYDIKDASTAWSWSQWQRDYLNELNGVDFKGVRIGVLKSLMGTETIHTAVNTIMNTVFERLISLGADLVWIDEPIDTTKIVEEISLHLYDFQDHLNSYLNTLPSSCPYKTMNAIYESGLFHPGVCKNLETALSLTTHSDAYRLRLQKRYELQESIVSIMANYGVSLLVYPHQKQLVCKVGDSQRERNGVIGAVTGFPSICLPAGFSPVEPSAPIGVPVGFELLGRPFEDERLLGYAYTYEKHFNTRISPIFPVVR